MKVILELQVTHNSPIPPSPYDVLDHMKQCKFVELKYLDKAVGKSIKVRLIPIRASIAGGLRDLLRRELR